MKLLTPDIGWAATKDSPPTAPRLYWTTSAGAQWKDITPPHRRDEGISCVFFLDTETGWVLLSYGDEDEPEPQFELAATADAGATWSVTHVSIPDLHPESTILAGDGHIAFADAAHGWMNLDRVSGAAFNLGALLMTSDGGRTWNWSPDERDGPAIFGSVTLVTPRDGWLAGGPGNTELYATHDGGNSWQQLDMKAPKEVSPATNATYNSPIFEDAQRGFLPVTYSGAEDTESAAVLFSTKDGGRTWRPESILRNPKEGSMGRTVLSTVVDSTWVIALTPGHLVFSRLGASAGTTEPNANPDLFRHGISALTFATPTQGWILTNELLSTADGGATWTKITPQPSGQRVVLKPIVTGSSAPAEGTSPAAPDVQMNIWGGEGQWLPNSVGGATANLQTNINRHVGFDEYLVASSANTRTWWNNSPYFDIGFYLNGGLSHVTDKGLNASWVASVSGQGWGLMPLWSGLQAPCACLHGNGTYPGCALYPHTFSNNLVTAKSQGATEADNAKNSANGLGLAGTII